MNILPALTILAVISYKIDSTLAQEEFNCLTEGFGVPKSYSVIDIRLPQQQGVQECLNRGWVPAVVRDPNENLCLGGLLDSNGWENDLVFTAGVYSPDLETFVWEHFHPMYHLENVDFHNWANGEPRQPGCIVVGNPFNQYGPQWRSTNCNQGRYIACQRIL